MVIIDTSLTVSLVSKRYIRGIAEMKLSSLFVRISTKCIYIYILHDGSSQFNFSSGAPVCLVD